ncbi:hypothetical protein EV193_105260 [Herbihabitans rhizosphaerae]|uniref:Uncharacterized protein n=1 Tax=Herbihabitans rhizosphaerae TaxID=1872711 RepID=A0A4Q7KQU3_9PSEU|nr:hypothetical protein [Herbihabitans rhizosphaerae]RZS37702.1 hypothetical protein EV193_105260 [Herbihabitans rhizosphaerae]
MKHAYVLSEQHGTGFCAWFRHHRVVPLEGPSDALVGGLRRWARKIIETEQFNDGRYCASLVELDADGEFDIYFAIEIEDIFWFYEQEYVPAS